MAKKDDRGPVSLKCPNCGHMIRPTEKNKKNTTDKLTVKKYCPNCGRHAEFKEHK